jgi:amino acid permease
MNFRNIKYILTYKQAKKYENEVLDRLYCKLIWLMIKLQNKETQVQNFLKSKKLLDTHETLKMAVEWLDIPITSVDILCDISRVRKQVQKTMNVRIVIYFITAWVCFFGTTVLIKDRQINFALTIIYSVFIAYFSPLFIRKYEVDFVARETDKFIEGYLKSKTNGLRRIK